MNHTIRVLAGLILAGGMTQAVFAEAQAEDETTAKGKGVFVTSNPGKKPSEPVAPLPATPVVAPSAAVLPVKKAAAPQPKIEDAALHFEIRNYTLDGATLLSKEEIAQTVAPYTGKHKDFSDVEKALEAIEALYAGNGYTAVHVLLPEQELEQGDVHFHVIESHFGKITVKNNKLIKYVSEQNALNALPSVSPGNVPVPRLIARELKLANENPARQLNVVLKAGDKDELVDATVLVADTKPGAWNVNYDNSGTVETGRSRLSLSYRYANLFDLDHVASFQTQVSPEHVDRVKVFSGNYKIPFYDTGDSAEFAVAYSNVNSLVGGLSNFQGGGKIFSSRYNQPLDRVGRFDPRLSYGLDLRDFLPVQQTTPPVTVMYNEIIVSPVSLTLSAQGKLADADVGLNASVAANLPWFGKGHPVNFAQYDLISLSTPNPKYRLLRYGGNLSLPLWGDWQFRTAFNGQWSKDLLIQGEQLRLGGMDGVRGFAEGSEGGDQGIRGNAEFYTAAFQPWQLNVRGLVFYDAGQVSSSAGAKTSISSYGAGLRSVYSESIMLRMDAARIAKAGNDPQQLKGDWRLHLALSLTF